MCRFSRDRFFFGRRISSWTNVRYIVVRECRYFKWCFFDFVMYFKIWEVVEMWFLVWMYRFVRVSIIRYGNSGLNFCEFVVICFLSLVNVDRVVLILFFFFLKILERSLYLFLFKVCKLVRVWEVSLFFWFNRDLLNMIFCL